MLTDLLSLNLKITYIPVIRTCRYPVSTFHKYGNIVDFIIETETLIYEYEMDVIPHFVISTGISGMV